MFAGADRKFRVKPRKKLARERQNKPRDFPAQNKRVQRLVAAEKRKRQQLKELGVTYEFNGYKDHLDKLVSATKKKKQATPQPIKQTKLPAKNRK